MITTDIHLTLRLQWRYTFTPPIHLHYMVLPMRYGLVVWELNYIVGTRFSAEVHAAPGTHTASCTMGTWLLSRGQSSQGRGYMAGSSLDFGSLGSVVHIASIPPTNQLTHQSNNETTN